jgi:hypothetical protein
MAKDAFYFSHDSNASQDPKILQMCSVYKAEGYGWYWMLIEMMREQENYKLLIQGKYAFNSLAIRSYTNVDTFVSFVNDCVNEFGLFCRDEKYLWSESLIRRMKIKDEKSEKARESVRKRWDKDNKNTFVSNEDTNVSNEDTIKKSKVNEIKENKNIYAEFVKMTSEENEKLVNQYGLEKTTKMIETLNNYKGSNGKKYKSDYLAILNWVVEKVSPIQKQDQYRRFEV